MYQFKWKTSNKPYYEIFNTHSEPYPRDAVHPRLFNTVTLSPSQQNKIDSSLVRSAAVKSQVLWWPQRAAIVYHPWRQNTFIPEVQKQYTPADTGDSFVLSINQVLGPESK